MKRMPKVGTNLDSPYPNQVASPEWTCQRGDAPVLVDPAVIAGRPFVWEFDIVGILVDISI